MTQKFATVFILLLSWACDDPYDQQALLISSHQNIDGKVLDTYVYKKGNLYTFVSTNQATAKAVVSNKFYFADQLLDYIVGDSTTDSYKLTKIYYRDEVPEQDSVFAVTASGKTLIASHYFQFDENCRWKKTGTRNLTNPALGSETEFHWDGDNITEMITHNINGAERTVATTATISYDKKSSMFPADFVYFYTRSETELYRFSSHNPLVVTFTGKSEQSYVYSYNKFGYPSGYADAKGGKYAAKYIGVN